MAVADRTCGRLGCNDDAHAVIHHPKHGRRVVCEGDAAGHEVVEHV